MTVISVIHKLAVPFRQKLGKFLLRSINTNAIRNREELLKKLRESVIVPNCKETCVSPL